MLFHLLLFGILHLPVVMRGVRRKEKNRLFIVSGVSENTAVPDMKMKAGNVMAVREQIKPLIGIYEKAMPASLSWERRFDAAANAGYDFLEISIDETDERLSRLDWDASKLGELKRTSASCGIPILSMCLSGHRRFPIGSEDAETCARAMEIMEKAIKFSVGTGIRIIQLAGYDAYYEKSTENTKKRFYDNLRKSVEWAAKYGVMLAIEPVDTDFMDSVSKAMIPVELINSPWLQVYPDTGNLTGRGYDVVSELQRGSEHVVAVHIKDAKPNIIRKVPFGEGIVRFEDIFRTLKGMNFTGPFLIEMWNDENPDYFRIIRDARLWVMNRWDCSTQ